MTKRERRAKVKRLHHELVSKIQKQFPLVEFQQLEERPDGVFALLLYAPYDDTFGIIDQVLEDIHSLADEGIYLRVLPLDRRLPGKSVKHRAA